MTRSTANRTPHKNVSKALQQANRAVWSLHMSSQGRLDTDGHQSDAIRSMKEAIRLLKNSKKKD
jgi:hypothetical protein